MKRWPDLSALGERLEATSPLDRLADPIKRAVDRVLPNGPTADALHGVWLGHPLHPLLTDLPIGFWTSSFVLDLGGRRTRSASTAMVAAGVACALPTAAAGLADWRDLNRPERRTGVVHALANTAATALYLASLSARLRGRWGRGVALGMAGATAATVGGFLGGHLSYRRAAGVNHVTDAPEFDDWTDVSPSPAGSAPLDVVDLDGTPLVVEPDAEVALAARCSHLGGPLEDGDVAGGCVRCPWHGSTFDLRDGAVARGPATAPQPAYEVRQGPNGKQVRSRSRAR